MKEYPDLFQRLKFLTSNNILSVNGYQYDSGSGSIKYYVLTVTLMSGEKYTLRLTKLLTNQSPQYIFTSFISNDNTISKKYSFSEEPRSSADILNIVNSINLDLGQINTSSLRLQSEASNANIIRITFRTVITDYS